MASVLFFGFILLNQISEDGLALLEGSWDRGPRLLFMDQQGLGDKPKESQHGWIGEDQGGNLYDGGTAR